jgi:hypothetical protein
MQNDLGKRQLQPLMTGLIVLSRKKLETKRERGDCARAMFRGSNTMHAKQLLVPLSIYTKILQRNKYEVCF